MGALRKDSSVLAKKIFVLKSLTVGNETGSICLYSEFLGGLERLEGCF